MLFQKYLFEFGKVRIFSTQFWICIIANFISKEFVKTIFKKMKRALFKEIVSTKIGRL